MTKIKRTQGITLIALIITIVIMLILASVTIGTINGGLFEYAGKAKKNVESSSEKEILQNAIIMAKEKGKLNQESLRDELSNYNVEVLEDGTSLIVNFKNTNNFYEIDSNEKISYLEDAKSKTY